MRRIMMKAREMGQTKGDYAFLYLDLYNTNRSFTWTDADDSPAKETGNEEEPSYSSGTSAVSVLLSLKNYNENAIFSNVLENAKIPNRSV